MKLVIIGSGYVGLVTGVCFANMGHHVALVDIDEDKLQIIRQGKAPFYEPGLEDLLLRNLEYGRLSVSSDLSTVIDGAEFIFICVGTPEASDGSANLSYVESAAKAIGQHMANPLIVVNKSTVPVGTADKVREIINKELGNRPVKYEFDVASNPEFLKEGSAVKDFMYPDRIVVGCVTDEARSAFEKLYAPFTRTGKPILFMDCRSAEMTKYVANGLLASRISFMNEVARLCDFTGADVDLVRLGAGSDSRIGSSFLFPGLGYGGSCFPKDVSALRSMGKPYMLDMEIVTAVASVNNGQSFSFFDKICAYFSDDIEDKVFGLWGLSFKPNTDDIREAPARMLIHLLLKFGAAVKVFDPKAMNNMEEVFGKRIEYCTDAYACCSGADGLIIATEWEEFRSPDFVKIKQLLKHPALFDGRNIYDLETVASYGFDYIGVGRKRLANEKH
jgi:UDPglucose 6-dehydrogenase